MQACIPNKEYMPVKGTHASGSLREMTLLCIQFFFHFEGIFDKDISFLSQDIVYQFISIA